MVGISSGVFSQCIGLNLLLPVVKNFWQTNCVTLSNEENQTVRKIGKEMVLISLMCMIRLIQNVAKDLCFHS